MKGKVAVLTLGCKLNYSESSTIARDFVSLGYDIVSQNSEADVFIVNTCSVTEHSDKKCRNIIHRLHRRCPEAVIAVVGCYAQLKGDEIGRMEGVDIVFGAHRKLNVAAAVDEYIAGKQAKVTDIIGIDDVNNVFPAYSTGERTRSFLKVQDGCDYKCAYCTVPYARGHSRNLPIAQLVDCAEKVAAEGIKEIVLTGVNTGDFGKTTGESFLDLLKALQNVEGIERYRISSIEPNLLTEEIVDWIASGTKFLPHFHIPLQSGCDVVLKRMGRRYRTEDFRRKLEYIRSRMENVFFGIDVIVGFPGETEEQFNVTVDFLKEIKPAFIHIFPYSRRSGTPAAEMPDQVPDMEKTRRVEVLEALCVQLHEDFCHRNAGRMSKVLFESKTRDGKMYGYTENYIKVEKPYDRELIGKIVEVAID